MDGDKIDFLDQLRIFHIHGPDIGIGNRLLNRAFDFADISDQMIRHPYRPRNKTSLPTMTRFTTSGWVLADLIKASISLRFMLLYIGAKPAALYHFDTDICGQCPE